MDIEFLITKYKDKLSRIPPESQMSFGESIVEYERERLLKEIIMDLENLVYSENKA